MKYLLFSHSNNGNAKALHCYVTRTLPVLLLVTHAPKQLWVFKQFVSYCCLNSLLEESTIKGSKLQEIHERDLPEVLSYGWELQLNYCSLKEREKDRSREANKKSQNIA
jgi:hypothetical protein